MVRVAENMLPLLALVLSACIFHTSDAFVVVPVWRTTPHRVSATRSSSTSISRVQARPDAWRRQSRVRSASMMSTPLSEDSTTAGMVNDVPASPEGQQMSKLGRISQRIRKIIKKAIMGYLPEEEAAADAAAEAAEAAERLAQIQVRDQRLMKDAAKARTAAEGVVAAAHGEPVAAPKVVQLDIGNTSPMEAEDMMASLRKRMEDVKTKAEPQQASAVAETEARVREETETEKLRREIQLRSQARARERREIQDKEMLEKQAIQETRERMGRPANFDGDTAVAERPKGDETDAQGTARNKADAPKMASREQIERLNRMFGSAGGERLP